MKTVTCPDCGGDGGVPCSHCSETGMGMFGPPDGGGGCSSCVDGAVECPHCGGRGDVVVDEVYEGDL